MTVGWQRLMRPSTDRVMGRRAVSKLPPLQAKLRQHSALGSKSRDGFQGCVRLLMHEAASILHHPM